jgi:very-short-patch-repair endonuclease
LSETHRRNGHTVPPESAYRSAPTKEEIRLAAALPARWFLHHRLDRGTKHGARSLVEIDLALPAARVAVEVDGPGHRLTKQKAIDRRKEDFLMSRGWRVIRVGNEEVRTALEGCDAFITAVAARPACEEEVAPW